MKAGFFHSSQRQEVRYRLKRQVVVEYRLELEQATGLKKWWLRWKRRVALENKYNQLLFSANQQIAY
jgi:hypothetical protein